MALLGRAALAMWWEMAPEMRADFEHWHAHEHFPERLASPGFHRGTRWSSASGGDGVFARGLVLGGVPVAVTNNPELKALYDTKRSIEEKINTLRGMKPRMEAAVYDRELEKLLVELAETNLKIKQLETKK